MRHFKMHTYSISADFGTLAGVRGFKDPNVQVNADTGKNGEFLLRPPQSRTSNYSSPYVKTHLQSSTKKLRVPVSCSRALDCFVAD